jgi:hypothetical protein
MAKSAGYAATYDFDDLEDFATRIEKILDEPGPALVCVKTTPNPRERGQRAQEMGYRRRNITQAIPELMKDLGVA